MGYGSKVAETRNFIHEEIILGNYSREPRCRPSGRWPSGPGSAI